MHYLTKRTEVPITVADNLITMPEDSKKGTDKPIKIVAVLSGFGSLVGDNVASRKPSRYTRRQNLMRKSRNKWFEINSFVNKGVYYIYELQSLFHTLQNLIFLLRCASLAYNLCRPITI